MEGSTMCFDTSYVPSRATAQKLRRSEGAILSPQEGNDEATSACARPLTRKSNEALGHAYNRSLPKIEYMQKKKLCEHCQRGTHLRWEFGQNKFARFRICQGCAKRRGDSYRFALRLFFDKSGIQPLDGEKGFITLQSIETGSL